MAYIDSLVEDLQKNYDRFMESTELFEQFNFDTSNQFIPIDEETYDKVTDHLRLEVIDMDRFIKTNDCKEITNPVFYTRDNIPTSDGLLSNTIFGITQNDRAGIFGYISLDKYFIDPSCYKNWCKIDNNIKKVVHKEGKFSINSRGEIVPDENGSNGVDFLRKNIKDIKFKSSDSIKRDLRVKFLEKNRYNMFINKWIVIPPYYRDTNSGKRSVGVGGVNKLYSQLIVAVNSIKMTQEYGFDLSGAMEGRVQEILVCIYDWFAGNSNKTIQTDVGAGLSTKFGIIRHALMGKTTNYAARVVITGAELKANRPEDMKATYRKSFAPLAACIACLRPFVQYNVRAFFEREFIGTTQYPIMDSNGKIVYKEVKDPLITFSDERIKKEMESFLHGYNNRFVPIEVPIVDNDNKKIKYYMTFRGNFSSDNPEGESITQRRLTWCDIFYMAAVEAARGRMGVITRYPIDSRFNQVITEIEVASTKDTEPMIVNGTYYRYYPKFTDDMIGMDTSASFVDSLNLSNLYLPGNGGDFDGDTVTLKFVYTDEANAELREFVNKKENFIDLNGSTIRQSSGDVIMSLYALTKVLSNDKSKLTQPTFK